MRVSAIVPAYNEAGHVGATVRSLLNVPDIDEVIVIDDGSKDGTKQEAEQSGAKTVRLPRRRGKAAALQAGVTLAQGEVILFVDADLGASAHHARRLLLPVLAGECELAIGRLPQQVSRGGWGLAVGLARKVLSRVGGADLEAPLSGQRACRRRLLERMTDWGRGYGVEVAMTRHVLLNGGRISEIPIAAEHRVTTMNLAGIRHRGRQFWDIARTTWRWLLEW